MPGPHARVGQRLAGRDPGRDAQEAAGPRLTAADSPALLVVLGPTGTGKSALALALAQAIGGEIVSCDALQVYRGFDVGTAKPPRTDRARVPHFMVDVCDPRRDFALADYVRGAEAAIAAIAARGHTPLVVGGTGMYLRGLLRGIVAAPPRDAALRARLSRIAGRAGLGRLRRLLARLDPKSEARIPPGDAQRTIRALELALAGGANWSERLAREGTWSGSEERYRALKIGLEAGRAVLDARLAARAASFLDAGLADEVRGLLDAGVPASANAFKGIGYREVLRALEAGRDPKQELGAIVTATRRYAKRQRTWFRSESHVHWLDAGDGAAAVYEHALALWRAWFADESSARSC